MSDTSVTPRPRSSWGRQAWGWVHRAAVEFIYPPTCLLCDVEIPSRATTLARQALCERCQTALAPPPGNACRRCGAPVGPYTLVEDDCLVCRRESYAFDEVIRLGLYRDDLRTACLMSKNPGGALLGQTLADLLIDARQSRLAEQSFQAVIPVPEHWLKHLVRQQYAAETIARRISDRLKVRLSAGILAKVRWTAKQAKSSPVERRQQQKDAFRVIGHEVRGQTILLVDDILTTGATADAAARELKRAGASRVVVAVVAVSPPRT